MAAPNETMVKKAEEGLGWLRECAYAAVGKHIGDKELLDARRESVIRLSYELEDKWRDLVERGKGENEDESSDQLDLPHISGQRCNVLDDTDECVPDPARPECRMYCGVWPAGLPATKPSVSWLTVCTLTLDVSPCDPETGEVLEEYEVYHRPATLGPVHPLDEPAELEPVVLNEEPSAYRDKTGNVYKVVSKVVECDEDCNEIWQAWKHKLGFEGRLVPVKVAPTSHSHDNQASAQAELEAIANRKGWTLLVEDEKGDQSKARIPAKKRGNGWA